MSTSDIMMECPYNKAHLIIRHRMPFHIVKCQKSYAGPPLDTCAYNAMHRLPAGAMTKHLEQCAEYHIFMKESYLKKNPMPANSIAFQDDDY